MGLEYFMGMITGIIFSIFYKPVKEDFKRFFNSKEKKELF